MTDITKIHEALTAYRYAKACESGAGAYGIAEARMIREFEENAPKWVEELIDALTSERDEALTPTRGGYVHPQLHAQIVEAHASKHTALLVALETWCAVHGSALKPPGADTYGEGMRDAKQQVRRIIAQVSLRTNEEARFREPIRLTDESAAPETAT